MAWICVRCEKRIYDSRPGAIRFAMVWKYVKKRDELTVDLKRIDKIPLKATITHVHCKAEEVPDFKEKMREKLKVPDNKDHPLLI